MRTRNYNLWMDRWKIWLLTSTRCREVERRLRNRWRPNFRMCTTRSAWPKTTSLLRAKGSTTHCSRSAANSTSNSTLFQTLSKQAWMISLCWLITISRRTGKGSRIMSRLSHRKRLIEFKVCNPPIKFYSII